MRSPSPDDRELWSQAVSGDRNAFGVLFDRHAKAVYNHCFRLTASWSTAEDLTQNTFLLAWRKRHKVRLHGESALPWLLAVATNAVRSNRRSVARRLRTQERTPADAPTPDHADDVASRIDDEVRMAELLDAVHDLPRGLREAFTLCVWGGVGYPEAAAALGIKETAVRVRVSRAKARLTASTRTSAEQLLVPVVPAPLEDR